MAEYGEWGTVSYDLPDYLEDVRVGVNDVAEFLLAFLDVALAALAVIKAFAVGFLDPIAALVQAIINQIKALLDDLKNLGIYITGDWALLKQPYDDLRGGYVEYERRMIARMTDRTDPTRPDVSSVTEVFAAFFYISVDFTEINRLIKFVKKLLGMFNQSFNPSGTPPVPLVTGIQFGNQADANVFDALENVVRFDADPPEKFKITWKVQPTGSKSPFNPFPPIGPKGFLVTVGTREEGIPLVFNRPENDAKKREPEGGATERRSRREYGDVLDRQGRPVILYGGYDMIGPVAGVSTHDYGVVAEGPNQFQPGQTAVYGIKSRASGEIIALNDLVTDADTYLLQRTFRVEASQISAWAKKEYSIVIEYKDLPHDAEFKVDNQNGDVTVRDLGVVNTYYVRIASTDNVEATLNTVFGGGITSDKDGRFVPGGYQHDFSTVQDLGNNSGEPFRIPQRDEVNRSAWSPAFKATIPNANTGAFLDAVATALMILVLSRSDLPLLDEMEGLDEDSKALARGHKKMVPGVALLRTGLEPYSDILDVMYPGGSFRSHIEKKDQNPQQFRQDLMQRCRSYAKNLCDQIGARPELHEFIAQNSIELRTTTIQQLLTADEPGAITALKTIAPTLNDAEEDFTLLDAINVADDQETRAAEQALNESSKEIGEEVPFPGLPRSPAPFLGAWRDIGFAPNPYSMEVPESLVEELMGMTAADPIRGRKGDFIEVDPRTVQGWDVQTVVKPEDTIQLLDESPGSLRMFYEKYVQDDGSIEVPTEVALYLNELSNQTRKVGSADLSPVFYFGAERMRFAARFRSQSPSQPNYGARYLRTMFREYEGGLLYTQSALVLSIASSVALRVPEDGEWIAIRFLDSFPALDNFFDQIQQWLDALSEALKSVSAAIIEYIEFVEDRIIELQRLILRINSLIQSILGFTVGIPKCSALLFSATGTDGVLQKFITADLKPSDSPLAYGGGVAILAPLVPSFIVELLRPEDDGPDPANVVGIKPLFGLENLDAPSATPPDDEPDVL